jgi:ABC-2 type transport system ATP-binding protein/lipopolysaccharide transport system ATP-binding protein
MTLVEVRSLSKKFATLRGERSLFKTIRGLVGGGENIGTRGFSLRDISFTLASGEKLGLVGRNGSGKTTLLRLIAGIFRPSSGEVRVGIRPTCLLSLNAGMFQDLSVEENARFLFEVLFRNSKCSRRAIDEIIEFAGLSEDRDLSVKHLSRGQRQRLSLSAFLSSNSDLVLFDEAFAFVDQDFLARSREKFREVTRSSTTVIYTSHDLDFIEQHTSRVLWLEDGRLRMLGESREVLSQYRSSFGA